MRVWRPDWIRKDDANMLTIAKSRLPIAFSSRSTDAAGADGKVPAVLLLIGGGIAERPPANAYAIIRQSPCPVLSV
jgi:hypothetical protein